MIRKHSLINLIDIVLVLILIATVIVFSYLSFNGSERFDFAQKENLTLTMRVKDIPRKYEGLIKINDNVFCDALAEAFGKVKAVSYTNSSVEFLDKVTNTSSIYKSPDKLDVLMTVECEAHVENNAYVIGNVNVAIGDVLNISTPSFTFSATIIKIETNEA